MSDNDINEVSDTSDALAEEAERALPRMLLIPDSSTVKEVGYSLERRQMFVVFKGTPSVVYRYDGVSSEEAGIVFGEASVGIAVSHILKQKPPKKSYTKLPYSAEAKA